MQFFSLNRPPPIMAHNVYVVAPGPMPGQGAVAVAVALDSLVDTVTRGMASLWINALEPPHHTNITPLRLAVCVSIAVVGAIVGLTGSPLVAIWGLSAVLGVCLHILSIALSSADPEPQPEPVPQHPWIWL